MVYLEITETIERATLVNKANVVLLAKQKSLVSAFLLALLFGPIGLFYASLAGGLMMIIIGAILFIKALTGAWIVLWIICIIWAVWAVIDYNKQSPQKFIIKYKFDPDIFTHSFK